MGQVGFHRTVPLVLHGTGRIPKDCPTCPTWDKWDRTDEGVGGTGWIPLGHRISWDAGGILMAYLDITRHCQSKYTWEHSPGAGG